MNDFAKQTANLWGQFSLLQKAIIGLAVIAVIGFIIGVGFVSGKPEMQLLYGKLNEKDMSEVVTAVQAQGVKYELGNGGGSIYVPVDKVHQLRAHLASKGVPAGDGVGYEIFDRTNFGISDFVQRANYLRALQGELARTISQFSGVRTARVMIVMPENKLILRSETRTKPTASVFIDQNVGGLSPEGINSIRFLVANSVESLSPNDVAVVDSRGTVLTEGLTDDPALGLANSQMKFRKQIEDYFSKKVETMLTPVLGVGNAVVRVSAELDSETSTTVKEVFDPDGQVVRTESINEDVTVTSEGVVKDASQGGVGVTANVPAPQAPAPESSSAPAKSSEQSRKTRNNAYEINKTTVNTAKGPGAISRLTAAVFVAAKSEPRTPQQLESLRKMVANAIGISAANPAELNRSVSLEEAIFDIQPIPEVAPLADPVYQNEGLTRNIIAGGVALLAAFIFWRMLKSAKSEEIPMEILGMNKSALEGNQQEKLAISPEMLNEMIRQKPANVGAALRGWMASESQPTSKD